MYIKRSSLPITIAKGNSNARIFHMFKRWWKIRPQKIDGVEVYERKMTYWNGSRLIDTKEFNHFIDVMGIKRDQLDENVKEGRDYDEVDRIFFKLEQKSGKNVKFEDDYIKDMLNNITSNEFKITVSTFDTSRFYDENMILDKQRVIDSLFTYIMHQHLGYTSPDDVYDFSIMLNEPIIYTSVDPDDVLSNITDGSENNPDNMFAIFYPDAFDILDSKIVAFSAIVNNNLKVRLDITLTLKRNRDITSSEAKTLEDSFNKMRQIIDYNKKISKIISDGYGSETFYAKTRVSSYYNTLASKLLKEFPPPNDEVFYKGYLRTNVFGINKSKTGLSKTYSNYDFADMLRYTLGSGYKQKDAEVWEIVTAVVIIIMLIAITILTWGSAAGYTIPAAGYIIAGLSIASAVGSYVLANEGGRSAMYLVKTVGDFTMWTGIANSVVGLYTSLANKAATASAAASQAAGSTVTVTIADIIVDSVVDGIVNAVTTFKGAISGIETISNLYSTVMNVYNNIKNNTVRTESNAPVKDFADDTETQQIIFEGEQFEQLTKIDMMYADLYDYSKYTNTNERKTMI